MHRDELVVPLGIDELELVGTFRNAIAAFSFLQQNPVDLIFLDIEMPKLSGIDFLKTLKKSPKVIITTAYRDYAIDIGTFEEIQMPKKGGAPTQGRGRFMTIWHREDGQWRITRYMLNDLPAK